MSTPVMQTAPPFIPPLQTPLRIPSVRLPSRRNSDVLGLIWVHGALEAAVFRRQATGAKWASPVAVQTLDEFEIGLDAALSALKFTGSEVFLVLEHEAFVHQAEHAPAFSDSAARAYLRGRIERFEHANTPVLWVSQRTVSVRSESAFLLHMLPTTFYAHLNGLLSLRRLDLTRILPLAVPLQLMLEKIPAPKDQPILLATEAGGAITVLLSQVGSQLYFTRTMQARWTSDAARVAVEINRSFLYAKQQFGVAVEQLWLLGTGLEQAAGEVGARCGAGKAIHTHPAALLDWLQIVAKLSPRNSVNLAAGYLARIRRLQFLRRAVLAACWVVLIVVSLDSWSRAYAEREDRHQLQRMQREESAMLFERSRLITRNATASSQRSFIRQVSAERLPPVPAKFLAFVGQSLPAEISLTEFTTKWDEASNGWTFRLEGQITTDDDVARSVLDAWQRTLAKSPLRARVYDGARAIVPVPIADSQFTTTHRFSLEGGLFE